MIIPENVFESPPENSRDKPMSKESRDELGRYLCEHNLVAMVFSSQLKNLIERRAKASGISAEQWMINAVNQHVRRMA